MHFLGVDIGTSATKAVVIDEDLKIVAQATSDTYEVEMPHPTWAQQEANVWLKGFMQAVSKVMKEDFDVRALCVSGLYGGSGIPLSKEMEPLGPALIWMDKRAKEETKWVKEKIGADRLFDITGNYVDPYFGFTKILWLKKHHPSWKEISLLLSPKDYVIYKITGRIATDYSSAGNIGGVFDIHEKKWSDEMISELGLRKTLFVEEILSSDEMVGGLAKEYADLLGLKSGTPVICGGIDAAVATYACGVEKTGQNVAMIGTSMCWGTIHEGEHLTPKMVNMPYVIEPQRYVYSFGGATTAGAVVEWFKREFASDLTFEELEKKAREAGEDYGGIKVEPYFMGERAPIWNPDLRGSIKGLTLSTTKFHIYGAILKSIADSLKLNVETAKQNNIPLDDEIFVVGGVSGSKLLLDMIRESTGMRVKTLATSLDAPIGDAKLAKRWFEGK